MYKPLIFLNLKILLFLMVSFPFTVQGFRGGCSACGGITEGEIYVMSEVCTILDLYVDQTPYGGPPVFIEMDEVRGLTADGTVVADLIVVSNVIYSITLADLFLQNNEAPSGEDIIALYPLLKEAKAGNHRFEEPDRIIHNSINREFVWNGLSSNDGRLATSPVVMLYVDYLQDGNPRVPDGIINPYPGKWAGTIRVILAPF